MVVLEKIMCIFFNYNHVKVEQQLFHAIKADQLNSFKKILHFV